MTSASAPHRSNRLDTMAAPQMSRLVIKMTAPLLFTFLEGKTQIPFKPNYQLSIEDIDSPLELYW